MARRQAIGDGVILARDFVNEPSNVLFPEEFARRAQALKKVGVSVEVLDAKAMRKLGMHVLLGVRSGRAARRGLSSCDGTAAAAARSRSPSSARA